MQNDALFAVISWIASWTLELESGPWTLDSAWTKEREMLLQGKRMSSSRLSD